ncbi:D-tagatose-bisphosphate aldolase, class II, non-catalytic subunit [Devosia submarina]|uniref:D-tagatose-bisphosphate aldolase, class II, non-catalytic subunit n=1 Tax=Devosia submarina TaxID=1173082 RepID=UPI000D371673|nr:D-tagatose-bisphosphate aldolase, class II, non-catalytic subunit [Devosia submarina]
MSTRLLLELPRNYAEGKRSGIVSICSAHPLVIEAALLDGVERGQPVLIEATCNQVNQEGGYTGMTPADFRAFVEGIAQKVGFSLDNLILGGDHLGPNPWKHLPAEDALARARVMVADFARAGFTKLHLDTSMGCLGEPLALPDELTALRAADLAAAAESALAAGAERPVYVIGTEVPIPGGALEALDHVEVTKPGAARGTVDVHRHAFAERGLSDALSRVIAIVVQPGVEFGNDDLVIYDRARSRDLVAVLADKPQVVFEAHSTDYQSLEALAGLVADGFSILKVGPALTFALREAFYGLDRIALELRLISPHQAVSTAMEAAMVSDPSAWEKYYPGDAHQQYLQRHFSLSDRIRYYWPSESAMEAADRLLEVLGEREIPVPLVSQYLGASPAATFSYTGDRQARTLVLLAVRRVIDGYQTAIRAP